MRVDYLVRAVDQDLSELMAYSHDLQNYLSTIKTSADLLILEGESTPQGVELVSLIRERALAAADFASSFVLGRAMKAGQYRAFTNELPLGDLLDSVETTLSEMVGDSFPFSSAIPPNASFSWTGDENLLLLTLRSMMRSLASASGCRPRGFKLQVDVGISPEGKLCLGFQAPFHDPKRASLELERDRLEIFAKALKGSLRISGTAFEIALGLKIQEGEDHEISDSLGRRRTS